MTHGNIFLLVIKVFERISDKGLKGRKIVKKEVAERNRQKIARENADLIGRVKTIWQELPKTFLEKEN